MVLLALKLNDITVEVSISREGHDEGREVMPEHPAQRGWRGEGYLSVGNRSIQGGRRTGEKGIPGAKGKSCSKQEGMIKWVNSP